MGKARYMKSKVNEEIKEVENTVYEEVKEEAPVEKKDYEEPVIEELINLDELKFVEAERDLWKNEFHTLCVLIDEIIWKLPFHVYRDYDGTEIYFNEGHTRISYELDEDTYKIIEKINDMVKSELERRLHEIEEDIEEFPDERHFLEDNEGLIDLDIDSIMEVFEDE